MRFQSTLPLRGATKILKKVLFSEVFQSTLPLRGATALQHRSVGVQAISIHAPLTGSDDRPPASCVPGAISIHAPLTGSDHLLIRRLRIVKIFQSTLPLRGATGKISSIEGEPDNFNPRSPYGERRHLWHKGRGRIFISIHAPLTGSDVEADNIAVDIIISIHAPLTGSDGRKTCPTGPAPVFQSTLPLRGATRAFSLPHDQVIFQSTLPLRGATLSEAQLSRLYKFQSTLPLRGATAITRHLLRSRQNFNPRSPYGERLSKRDTDEGSVLFQSTLPLRGATIVRIEAELAVVISIHAPLTGSDHLRQRHRVLGRYFNPRSPYGERPAAPAPSTTGKDFNPRSPYGERPDRPHRDDGAAISIHAPLTGSDSGCPAAAGRRRYFNPRSPYGERPAVAFLLLASSAFQSTLPLRGATSTMSSTMSTSSNFNPRSPYGERLPYSSSV